MLEERWRGGGQVNAGLPAGRRDLKAPAFCSVRFLTEGVDEVLAAFQALLFSSYRSQEVCPLGSFKCLRVPE